MKTPEGDESPGALAGVPPAAVLIAVAGEHTLRLRYEESIGRYDLCSQGQERVVVVVVMGNGNRDGEGGLSHLVIAYPYSTSFEIDNAGFPPTRRVLRRWGREEPL